MEMPKLIPVPIKTKGKNVFARMWAWITVIRKWEVAENWTYILSDGKKIIIPASFIFDGASIPRPLWGILSPTGMLLIQGLIHDFGYRYNYLWVIDTKGNIEKEMAPKNKERKHWDKLFRQVGEEVNGMKVINFLAWIVLSVLGIFAYNSNRKRNENDIIPKI